jgi:hypothetical protein
MGWKDWAKGILKVGLIIVTGGRVSEESDGETKIDLTPAKPEKEAKKK